MFRVGDMVRVRRDWSHTTQIEVMYTNRRGEWVHYCDDDEFYFADEMRLVSAAKIQNGEPRDTPQHWEEV